jgi:hypothetical protein
MKRRSWDAKGFCREFSLALDFGYDRSLPAGGRRHARGSDHGQLQGSPFWARHYPHMRAVVSGLPVELSPGRRTHGGAWRASGPCEHQPLGPEI